MADSAKFWWCYGGSGVQGEFTLYRCWTKAAQDKTMRSLRLSRHMVIGFFKCPVTEEEAKLTMANEMFRTVTKVCGGTQ